MLTSSSTSWQAITKQPPPMNPIPLRTWPSFELPFKAAKETMHTEAAFRSTFTCNYM